MMKSTTVMIPELMNQIMLKMILILVMPLLLRKKKKLKKTTKIQRGKQKSYYYFLNKVVLLSTQPVPVSINVNDNSKMMRCIKKLSRKYQDLPNVLPRFTPVREPGFYLDAPLLRGKYVTPIEFFQLYFTDDMINDICFHRNAYAWANIAQKQYYADQQGAWKEVTPNELKRLLALIIYFGLVKVNQFHDYWNT